MPALLAAHSARHLGHNADAQLLIIACPKHSLQPDQITSRIKRTDASMLHDATTDNGSVACRAELYIVRLPVKKKRLGRFQGS